MEPLKEHWDFALNAGLRWLKQLVYEFDLLAQESDQKWHAYVGAPEPQELIKIIDGFLEERIALDEGEISNLERMRLALEKELAPIYAQGKRKASEEWASASEQKLNQMDKFDFDDIGALGTACGSALDLSGPGLAWFVEAFVRQWEKEWMA